MEAWVSFAVYVEGTQGHLNIDFGLWGQSERTRLNKVTEKVLIFPACLKMLTYMLAASCPM